MSSDDGRSGERNGHPNKRRRIPLACNACRTRKSRCNGARPKCSTCFEFGFDCVYVQSHSSSNVIVGKEYFLGLESRLKSVEQDLSEMKAGMLNDSTSSLPQLPLKESRHLRFDNHNSVDFENDGGDSIDDANVQDLASQEEATDGMGAAMFTNEKDTGYFGPSSNIAFTRHLTNAVARVTQLSQSLEWRQEPSLQLDGAVVSISRPASPSESSRATRRKGPRKKDINIYALPSEKDRMALLQKYFSNTGLLFPYIHEKTFLTTYAEVRANGFKMVNRTWLGLLNIILALVTSTEIRANQSAQERAALSDIYYQRAIGLCDKQVMRGTSLEIVQYLLVMGQYLQGTQNSIQAWATHGLAVKAAFQLGLHSSEASTKFPPVEREIRKRTWYGCVILDRTLSMTFGRPAAVPENYVRIELPVDIETVIDTASAADTHKSTSLLFFNATIALYKLMWSILDQFYGGNFGCDKPTSILDIYTRLLQMEQQLMEWERNLPPQLTLKNSQDIDLDEKDAQLERFRVVLTLRFHNLRILLHRPVLIRFLDLVRQNDVDQQELTLLRQLGARNLETSISSSAEIITIVHRILEPVENRHDYLGAWWFSLYYTFNAALVVFASLFIHQQSDLLSLSSSDTVETWRKSLDDAVKALQLLDHENRSVDRCRQYLERLRHILASLELGNGQITRPIMALEGHAQSFQHLFQDGSGVTLAMMPDQTDPYGISPFGMEPGEFMTERDFMFLNNLFVHPQEQRPFATGTVQGAFSTSG